MGKMINLIIILVFIDLLFIVTGQLSIAETNPSSLILQAILDPQTILSTQFFTLFFRVAGLATILTTGAVLVGIINKAGIDIIGFASATVLLTGLAGDYITIWNLLRAQNPVLATLIFAPIILMFIFILVEWVRGKD
ncbi:hypothetical protein LCGC14_1524070 [marine sediment metagenome]|uniref:Uncharacterized protein n=1 Tax=marine sediment metagenome TaxID=412755 RepID=A0A0F9IXT7_9ZZZZ